MHNFAKCHTLGERLVFKEMNVVHLVFMFQPFQVLKISLSSGMLRSGTAAALIFNNMTKCSLVREHIPNLQPHNIATIIWCVKKGYLQIAEVTKRWYFQKFFLAAQFLNKVFSNLSLVTSEITKFGTTLI